MNLTKSNRIKKLAVGVTMTLAIGGGAAAVLLPTFASAAVTTQGADDPAGHVRHSADDFFGQSTPTPAVSQRADDSMRHDSAGSDDSANSAGRGSDDRVAEARHGADDPAGHARHGADDPAGHARHGADDPAGHI